ncbi:hypothetical protein ACWEN3_03665 [Streptomyces sp. NPDC004561]
MKVRSAGCSGSTPAVRGPVFELPLGARVLVFDQFLPHLDERRRRIYLAGEAAALGHGGLGAAMPALFGAIRAPSTPGTFLRAFAHGHALQLHAVHRRFLAGLPSGRTTSRR